jgi:DNA-directed RNA polymerase specialized sigma24 family protein
MLPDDQGSITRWLGDLKDGDLNTVQPLWERYFEQLVHLARQRLNRAHRPDAQADEEDAALSAFDSFCRAAPRGHFPRLDDRDDLWRVLVALTARKATDQVRRARRQKRGGGRVRGEADLDDIGSDAGPGGLDRLASPVPTPEFAAMAAEQYRHLFDILDDDELRRIATWKLEGLTDDEIAGRLGCARRTVARRLELIRTLWRAEAL